jgi:hypothetical protein
MEDFDLANFGLMSIEDIINISKYLPWGLYAAPDADTHPYSVSRIYVLIEIYYREIKPILRPLSDLYKQMYMYGHDFIPLVELANIANGGSPYSSNIEFKMYDNQQIAHSNDKVFMFNKDEKSFYMEKENYDDNNRPYHECLYVQNQSRLFDCMHSWKIDYFNLIERGIAIDANTLENNPYNK